MRKNRQIIVDRENGDCMRACLTSMLDLPNDPALIPLGGAKDWHPNAYKFLKRFGLHLQYEQKAFWRLGYWMASVKSKNYEGVRHAVVMKGTELWHDPSTKKRYTKKDKMLGGEIVVGGFFLEVLDPTKLHLLDEFRKSVSQGK